MSQVVHPPCQPLGACRHTNRIDHNPVIVSPTERTKLPGARRVSSGDRGATSYFGVARELRLFAVKIETGSSDHHIKGGHYE